MCQYSNPCISLHTYCDKHQFLSKYQTIIPIKFSLRRKDIHTDVECKTYYVSLRMGKIELIWSILVECLICSALIFPHLHLSPIQVLQ